MAAAYPWQNKFSRLFLGEQKGSVPDASVPWKEEGVVVCQIRTVVGIGAAEHGEKSVKRREPGTSPVGLLVGDKQATGHHEASFIAVPFEQV